MDTTREGVLRISDEEYELIILPAVSSLPDALLDALAQFYQKGGKLLLSAPASEDLLTRLQSLPSGRGAFAVLSGDLKAALGKLLIPDVRIDRREVTHIHREMDGRHIYFFASDSGQALKARLEMKILGKIERWDLETGEITHIPSEITEDGYTRVNWSFPPHGSLMLILSPKLEPLEKKPITEKGAEIQMQAIWEFACDPPNALPLDRWDLKISTKGDWLHYDYTTSVQMNHIPESVSLLLDDVESRGSFMEGMRFQIRVNGQEIPSEPSGYYVDPKWKTFKIGAHLLKPGENRIHLRFTNQSWAGEPKAMTIPPRLLGDFALTSDGHTIIEPPARIRSGASWADQGYPFYSGAAVYTQQVTLDEEFLSAGQIWLEATQVADMVEFTVNGESAAVRPWPPYRCEVSPLLKPGQNTISLKITNSMKNFIEGDAKASGLLGSVRLERETDAFC